METIIFYFLSGLCIASAISVLIFKNPINSALSLVVCMVGIAGLFVLLDAHFIAMIQLAVYAGAIMVLVLFVIMLLNVGSGYEIHRSKFVWGLATLVLLPVFTYLFWIQLSGISITSPTMQQEVLAGTVERIGKLLFTKYIFTFELASVVILSALTGAVLIAKSNSKKH